MKTHLVKRKGHLEKFDERKVYASCYAACLSGHLKKEKAEKIAASVTKDISKWIKDRKKVSSNDIFRLVIQSLKKHDREIAFLYETHRDVS